MIRKLHNSLLALSATTLSLAACLMATGTGMDPRDVPVARALTVASIPAPPAPMAAIDAKLPVRAEPPAQPVPGHRKGKSRRNRQTLAMPFFSFATRS